MVYKERLAQWLFENRKPLDLTVLKGQWVKEWLPKFHDVRVEIKLDGCVYRGRGMDKDADLAFTKAGAEAIERAVFSKSQPEIKESGQGGVALHIEESQAKRNALYELLERDQFLCHFFTQTPFIELNPSDWGKIDFECIKSKLAREGIEIILKRTFFLKPKTVICFARRLSPTSSGFKGIIGLGASDTLSESALKAVIECLTNVVWRMENPFYSEDFQSFHSKKFYGPKEHSQLYLGNSPECDLDWIFCQPTDDTKSLEWEDKVTFEKINVHLELLKTAPIHIFKASSKDVQNLFYGPTKREDLNWIRLEKFKGKNLSKEDINWAPHPIG